jgi:hypothetical protein
MDLLPFFAGLAVVLLTWATGKALLPSRDSLARSCWEDFSISYLLGTAVVVVLGNVVLALGMTMTVVTAAFVLIGLLGCGLAWNNRGSAAASTELKLPVKLLLGALAIGSIAATLAYPINEFDPMFHFAYKGKILTFAGTPFNPALTGMLGADGTLVDYGRIVTHPNYPLGIPILEALVASLSEWHDRWVQWPLSLWAACLPGAVFFGLRCISLSAAGFGAVIAAATPILYARNIGEKGMQSLDYAGLSQELSLGAGADLPVAALVTVAVALLLTGMRKSTTSLQLLGGLCLAGAASMKNEGQALLGVTLLALLVSGLLLPKLSRHKQAAAEPAPPGTSANTANPTRWRASWGVVVIAILALLPWLSIRADLPAIDENYTEHFTVENIMHYLAGGAELVEKSPKVIVGRDTELLENPPARIDHLPGYFWDEFTDWRSWGLLWLLLFVALPWRPRHLADSIYRWLTALVLGGVLLYFLILLVTPWYLPLLREKGIPERLLIHLLGPISMLIGLRFSFFAPTSAQTPLEAPTDVNATE